MGTPQFAVSPLEKMIQEGFKPVAVITAPDKPAGRGLQIKPSPVKEKALEHGIPVLQPSNLKDPDFLEQLRKLKPDLQFVVAFRMLPEAVWNLPALGTYNLHASLLPQYRGAAPIQHAVIQGEPFTGLTTFKLQHEIDTGAIAYQVKLEIGENETSGELHDRMLMPGSDLVVKTIRAIENGSIRLTEQNIHAGDHPLKVAPKLNPEFCRLNFNEPAMQVHNKIRGLSPFPGAVAILNSPGKTQSFKLLRSKISSIPGTGKPGEIQLEGRAHIYVSCTDTCLEITELQPSGKGRMSAMQFLNGFRAENPGFFT